VRNLTERTCSSKLKINASGYDDMNYYEINAWQSLGIGLKNQRGARASTRQNDAGQC
jgi:hypothetical protein